MPTVTPPPRYGIINNHYAPPLPVANWTSLRWSLLWVYAADIRPQDRSVDSYHTETAAWYLRRGRVTITAGRDRIVAHPGHWLLPWTNRRYRHEFTADAQLLSLRFHVRWPTGEDLFDHATPMLLRGADHPDLELSGTALQQHVHAAFPNAFTDLLSQEAPLQTHLRLQRLTIAWVEAYVAAMLQAGQSPRLMASVDPRLFRAMQYIDDHRLSEPFREPDLARFVGLSVGHLNHLFLRRFGITPRRQFEKRREEIAYSLVTRTQEPLKSISHRLGFSSPSHFTKWFHRHHHASPTTLRRAPHP